MSQDHEQRATQVGAAGQEEFLTYTIVVRAADDAVFEMVRHGGTEGVCFLWAEEGVSAHALALGAEPSDWNEADEDGGGDDDDEEVDEWA